MITQKDDYRAWLGFIGPEIAKNYSLMKLKGKC